MKDFFVGIDTSGMDLVATVLDGKLVVAAGASSFSNDSEGIEAFVQWLGDNSVTAREALICVENTGVYTERLCYELNSRGFDLVLLDPHKVWKAFGGGQRPIRSTVRRLPSMDSATSTNSLCGSPMQLLWSKSAPC